MAKSSDKFLLAIVIGILLLVGISFAVIVLMPEPSYQAEDTPEGVLYNYLLAFQRQDYERAYRYLSPTLENYPADLEEFLDAIHSNTWQFDINAEHPSSFNITSSKIVGESAMVDVEFSRYSGGGLFDSDLATSTTTFRLIPVDDSWQIISGGYNFWYACWNDQVNCR